MHKVAQRGRRLSIDWDWASDEVSRSPRPLINQEKIKDFKKVYENNCNGGYRQL